MRSVNYNGIQKNKYNAFFIKTHNIYLNNFVIAMKAIYLYQRPKTPIILANTDNSIHLGFDFINVQRAKIPLTIRHFS